VCRAIQLGISLVLMINLSIMSAATPVIGVVTANGNFNIDSSSVRSNATVFEGSTIETDKASSRLKLNGGNRVELGSLSRGTVYRDRLVLEKGGGEFNASKDFRVEVLSLRITPSGGTGSGRISLVDSRTVKVATLTGELRVASESGLVLANLAPGMALAFVPQEAPGGTTTVTGCLQKSGDHYLLTDETSNVVFEIQGPDAAKMSGHRVQITGATVAGAAAPGATQGLKASSVTSLAAKCSLPAGGTVPPAASGTGGAAATGMSGTSKAVIAGVIIAGAGIGLGVGFTRGDDEVPVSPSSR
jgi:hypothetical protein